MVVLICPTAQGKMRTTGSFRMGSMHSAALSAVIASASEAIQKSLRGESLDCFVAIAPRNDDHSISSRAMR
jgi:hypothetical protein